MRDLLVGVTIGLGAAAVLLLLLVDLGAIPTRALDGWTLIAGLVLALVLLLVPSLPEAGRPAAPDRSQ